MIVTTKKPDLESAVWKWWAFAFYLPGDAASARVKIWRRLQDIGAASFKKALYLLPASDATLEDLEWTMKEVVAAGGQGVILEGTVVEGLSNAESADILDTSVSALETLLSRAKATLRRVLADEE